MNCAPCSRWFTVNVCCEHRWNPSCKKQNGKEFITRLGFVSFAFLFSACSKRLWSEFIWITDIWGNNWFLSFSSLTFHPWRTAYVWNVLPRRKRTSHYKSFWVSRPSASGWAHFHLTHCLVFCKKEKIRNFSNTTMLWTHYMWTDSDNSAIYCLEWSCPLSIGLTDGSEVPDQQ